MKYISVVILIALMSWTWCLATTERPFSLEDHKRVEAGVENDIREFILRKYPSTTDLYCQELYTEVIEPKTAMFAHFRCRTEGKSGAEETVTQTFEGYLRLESKDDFKTWRETDGQIKSGMITFNNGVKVTAKDDFPDVSDVQANSKKAEPPPPKAPEQKSEHK